MDKMIEVYGNNDEILSIINEIDEGRRKEYLYLILAELNRLIIEIKKLIAENPDEPDVFKTDLDARVAAIDTIQHYIENDKELPEETINVENRKIIFLTDEFGEPYFLRDINNIDINHYEDFLELLDGFEKGYAKKYKPISQYHQKVKQLSNIKQHRIILEQIEDYFIIIGAFIKKTKAHGLRERDTVSNMIDRYSSSEEFIMNAFNDEEFMENQTRLLSEVKTYLESRGKNR